MPVKEKTTRNKEIYEDKKKLSWSEMIRKWGLSYNTMYKIIKRERKKQEK